MSQVILREGRRCACTATPTVSNIRFGVSYCGCGFFVQKSSLFKDKLPYERGRFSFFSHSYGTAGNVRFLTFFLSLTLMVLNSATAGNLLPASCRRQRYCTLDGRHLTTAVGCKEDNLKNLRWCFFDGVSAVAFSWEASLLDCTQQ